MRIIRSKAKDPPYLSLCLERRSAWSYLGTGRREVQCSYHANIFKSEQKAKKPYSSIAWFSIERKFFFFLLLYQLILFLYKINNQKCKICKGTLKRSVSWDFWPWFFSWFEPIYSRSLINRLKYFRIWFWFRQDIDFLKSVAVYIPPRSQVIKSIKKNLQCASHRGVNNLPRILICKYYLKSQLFKESFLLQKFFNKKTE